MEVRKSIAVQVADSTKATESKTITTIATVTIGSEVRDKTQVAAAGLFQPDSKPQR